MLDSRTLLAVALFIIFSSSTSYKLTSSLGLPTEKHGIATRFGLILHSIVVGLLFTLLQNKV